MFDSVHHKECFICVLTWLPTILHTWPDGTDRDDPERDAQLP